MKKTLLLVLCLSLLVMALVSCGSKPANESNTEQTNTEPNAATGDGEAPDTNTPTKTPPPNPADYDFIQIFEAPEGNPRDIVYDYMLKMAKIEWVAAENWTTTWKGEGDFGVNLSYTRGKKYYGVPYSQANGSLDEFQQFINGKSFSPYPSPYYEEIVGNHCSSSMVMSYQQVLNFTYAGSLRPLRSRLAYLRFPDGIEIPPSRNPTTNPDDWISETVFKHNGQEAIYNGYAQLDKGDILYKSIDGSGHTRMVHKSEPYYSAAGKLMAARSFVYCLEQTNAWWDDQKNTTWWIDKKYTYSTLYDTLFMPVTFHLFHEENPVIDDAYIMMKGKNTPESILKGLSGTVESTFPLTYVRITIEDKDGKIVGEALEYRFTQEYMIHLRNSYYKLGIDKLEPGTYTYKLRAGIARGGCDIESFEFTIA